MSFSFLRSSVEALLILFLISCSNGPETSDGWVQIPDTQQAGYTLMMPVESGHQKGSLLIAGEEVPTEVNIAAHEGITFAAAHFDLPQSILDLDPQQRLERAWEAVLAKNGEARLEEPGPLGANSGALRNGWFHFSNGIRMGLVLHVLNNRAVALNAAVPEDKFDPEKLERILRYFNSLEITE